MNKPEKSLDDAIAKLPKWAQEEVQKRIDEAELWASLRQTEDVHRDVEIPEGFNDLSKGWEFNVHRAMDRYSHSSVFKSCSSSCFHGDGWDKTSSQQPRRLFSTRLLALKACRREVERKMAEVLWSLDKQIAEEIADPTPGPLDAVQ